MTNLAPPITDNCAPKESEFDYHRAQKYTHHYDASARRTADVMGDIFPDEP